MTTRLGSASYEDELAEVPDVLLRLAVMASTEKQDSMSEVARLLTSSRALSVYGMASSQWAAWPMVSVLRDRTELWIEWSSSYDGLAQLRNGSTNLRPTILVSQSGRTIETCDLAKAIKSTKPSVPIVVVTNSPGSPLTHFADIVVDIRAGTETHAPTKSYVNTVATLLTLSDAIQRLGTSTKSPMSYALTSIAGLLPNYLHVSDEWAHIVMATMESGIGSDHLHFLAGGPQLSSAWQSTMLCAETARHISTADDWATFRHGFEPQVDARFIAIGFRPSENPRLDGPPNVIDSVADSITRRQGTIQMVPQILFPGTSSDLPGATSDLGYWRPLWETLPVHYLCMRLADAKGLNAGEIERKVTEHYE
jgi:fructoselysine-6-P-deglycase FrlB-like protein